MTEIITNIEGLPGIPGRRPTPEDIARVVGELDGMSGSGWESLTPFAQRQLTPQTTGRLGELGLADIL